SCGSATPSTSTALFATPSARGDTTAVGKPYSNVVSVRPCDAGFGSVRPSGEQAHPGPIHRRALKAIEGQQMRTRVSDLFGIELPVFAFSHCRDVVAAVSRAGGLGVLGALAFSNEQLEVELDWIDAHVDGRPYGVD